MDRVESTTSRDAMSSGLEAVLQGNNRITYIHQADEELGRVDNTSANLGPQHIIRVRFVVAMAWKSSFRGAELAWKIFLKMFQIGGEAASIYIRSARQPRQI